jgi:DNA modification methylase
MMPKIELIQGDCLEKMKDIPDKSIDMVLTSPPYDNLRSYFVDKIVVWGYNVSYEDKQKVIKELQARGVKPISSP